MDQRNLLHPMTAGDLVESACVLAVRERGMGAEVETSIWECIAIEDADDGWLAAPQLAEGYHSRPDARATVVFHDRQTGERVSLRLKADTPLLFTRISR